MSAYLGHLPVWYGEIREFEAIGDAVDGECKAFGDEIEHARRGLFGAYADGEYLEHHERMCGVAAAGGEDERRRRLAVAYSSRTSYTERALVEFIEKICGAGTCEVYFDAGASVLSVAVRCDEATFSIISEAIERAAPCHLQVRPVRR